MSRITDKSVIRKCGDSARLLIKKKVLNASEIKLDEPLKISVSKGKIIITRLEDEL